MKIIIFLSLILATFSIAQEIDIKDALKQIELGNIKDAENSLKSFQIKNSNDPSVKFLDAVLTQNAKVAVKKFEDHFKNYPTSKYADASLFRIFSYYYSLGYYKKADTLLAQLKTKFPNSPYLRTADKTIPDYDDVEFAKNDSLKKEKIDFVKSAGKFSIQVGAFLSLENATKLSEQLKKEYMSVEIIQKEIGGTVLNVVYAGNFQNETEAKKYLEIINKKFNVSGRIVSKWIKYFF